MSNTPDDFLGEILARRILQIIGVYIASMWLAVEIGEWLTERFSVPADLPKGIFVGMITMLPAVIMMAWWHGRPGRDRWSLFQGLFLIANVSLAVLSISHFVQPFAEPEVTATRPAEGVTATETMSLTDEQGNTVVYEVAKPRFHQPIMASFWDNDSGDESLDWIQYAGPWLVAKDLRRSPVISVVTPYDSVSYLDQLRSRGFDRGLDTPLSLALQIAKKRAARWLLRGQFSQIGQTLNFTVRLYEVSTGEEVQTITASHENWLTALDEISERTSEIITRNLPSMRVVTDLKLAEHASESIPAIKALITGKNLVAFDNDFPASEASQRQALEIDSGFADAYVELMVLYRLMGDPGQAIEAARKALSLDYKLYQEDVFAVKATVYAMENKLDLTLKSLENWVKVYPQSVEALNTLATNYMILSEIDKAQTAYESLYALEPEREQTLLSLANIYRLKDQPERAIEVLNRFTEMRPDSDMPYQQLAATHAQFGEFDQARDAYEKAIFLGASSLTPEIGLAQITAYEQGIDAGLSALDDLIDQASTDVQRYSVLATQEMMLYHAGRLQAALEKSFLTEEAGNRFMPPLSQLFNLRAKRITYLVELGRFDEARQLVDEIRESATPPYNLMVDFFTSAIHEVNRDLEPFREATEVMESFLARNPIPAYEQMILAAHAKAAWWEGDLNNALTLFDEAIEESTRSFIILQTLEMLNSLITDRSRVLIELDRPDEAVAELDKVLARSPLNGSARMVLIEAYLALGRDQEAQAQYQRLLAQWSEADQGYLDVKKFSELSERINS